MAKAQAQRTHCPSGHPYSDENTQRSCGRHRCKTCVSERWHAAHPPTKIVATASERFWARFVKVPSGCWQWTAALDVHGYGHISVDGRQRGAHQAAWEILVGPIPEGFTIDHLCRNRGCVNPSHLEPVTRGENVLRGIGFAGVNVRKTHCPKGHEYTPENTYVNPNSGHRLCRVCRTEYWKTYVPPSKRASS